MPLARVGDINLYYEVEGLGKSNLILIHGLGGDGNGWSRVCPTLKQHYRLIIPDLRGHGRTGAYLHSFTIKTLADDIISLMNQANIESANILGSSMGGMVSQCLGIYYPERVNSLILANSECYISSRLKMIINNWIYLAENLGYRCYLENMIPWIYSETFFNSHEVEIKTRIDELSDRSVSAFIQAAKAVLKYDVSHLLSHISAPTLIIAGELDTLITEEYSNWLNQTIPNSQLEIIPYTGHMAIVEKPEIFCEIVLQFLERNISKH